MNFRQGALRALKGDRGASRPKRGQPDLGGFLKKTGQRERRHFPTQAPVSPPPDGSGPPSTASAAPCGRKRGTTRRPCRRWIAGKPGTDGMFPNLPERSRQPRLPPIARHGCSARLQDPDSPARPRPHPASGRAARPVAAPRRCQSPPRVGRARAAKRLLHKAGYRQLSRPLTGAPRGHLLRPGGPVKPKDGRLDRYQKSLPLPPPRVTTDPES